MGSDRRDLTVVIDPVEFAVRVVLATELGLPDIGPDDDIRRHGNDEDIARISEVINRQFGAVLQPSDLYMARTTSQITARLHADPIEPRSHVVVMNPEGRRPPMFLAAGAGSPAMMLHGLARALTDDQPVVIYEQVGVHQDEVPDPTVAAAATRYLDDLRRRYPSGPCVIVGYSWGGLPAYFMASQLREEGREVSFIAFEAMRQPWVRPLGRKIRRTLRRLRRIARDPRALARASRSRVQPTAIGSTARYDRLYRHAIRTAVNFTLPTLDAPKLLISTVDTPILANWDDEPDLHRVLVEGDHFSILLPRHVGAVAEAINHFIS